MCSALAEIRLYYVYRYESLAEHCKKQYNESHYKQTRTWHVRERGRQRPSDKFDKCTHGETCVKIDVDPLSPQTVGWGWSWTRATCLHPVLYCFQVFFFSVFIFMNLSSNQAWGLVLSATLEGTTKYTYITYYTITVATWVLLDGSCRAW